MKYRILATIASILLASVACSISTPVDAPQITAPPERRSVEAGVTPAPVENLLASPTPQPPVDFLLFTVTAGTVNVRNIDGESIGYLHAGEQITCKLADSGWCLMEQGHRIWAGCLDPNPLDLGCERKP